MAQLMTLRLAPHPAGRNDKPLITWSRKDPGPDPVMVNRISLKYYALRITMRRQDDP